MSSVRSPFLGVFCTVFASRDSFLVPGSGISPEQWCRRAGVHDAGSRYWQDVIWYHFPRRLPFVLMSRDGRLIVWRKQARCYYSVTNLC